MHKDNISPIAGAIFGAFLFWIAYMFDWIAVRTITEEFVRFVKYYAEFDLKRVIDPLIIPSLIGAVFGYIVGKVLGVGRSQA